MGQIGAVMFICTFAMRMGATFQMQNVALTEVMSKHDYNTVHIYPEQCSSNRNFPIQIHMTQMTHMTHITHQTVLVVLPHHQHHPLGVGQLSVVHHVQTLGRVLLVSLAVDEVITN